MSKWIIIPSVALITALLIGGGYFLFFRSEYKVATQVTTPSQPTPTTVVEMTTWQDQSQFSFQYPANLKLNPHDEDKINYAHVELTSEQHPGNLIVWTKDTKVASLADWIKKEKITSSLDSTLGGIPSKKVLLDGETKKILNTTIYNGFLYQIEVNPEDFDFWNSIYEQVSLSYKFTDIETPKQTQDKSSESPVEYSEEEVIE